MILIRQNKEENKLYVIPADFGSNVFSSAVRGWLTRGSRGHLIMLIDSTTVAAWGTLEHTGLCTGHRNDTSGGLAS